MTHALERDPIDVVIELLHRVLAARLDVRKIWIEAKQRELLEAAMRQLRSTWSVSER